MKPIQHKTQNDLSEKIRGEVCDLLNQSLADIVDLGTQTKQAHWNVKGPHFIGLHELFDKTYEELEEYTDQIAERIVQLGGVALGTARVAAKNSQLKEYPLDIFKGDDHVEALSEKLAKYGKSARVAIKSASDLDDADTADLFTEVSRGLDTLLWKVEAHIQAKS